MTMKDKLVIRIHREPPVKGIQQRLTRQHEQPMEEVSVRWRTSLPGFFVWPGFLRRARPFGPRRSGIPLRCGRAGPGSDLTLQRAVAATDRVLAIGQLPRPSRHRNRNFTTVT